MDTKLEIPEALWSDTKTGEVGRAVLHARQYGYVHTTREWSYYFEKYEYRTVSATLTTNLVKPPHLFEFDKDQPRGSHKLVTIQGRPVDDYELISSVPWVPIVVPGDWHPKMKTPAAKKQTVPPLGVDLVITSAKKTRAGYDITLDGSYRCVCTDETVTVGSAVQVLSAGIGTDGVWLSTNTASTLTLL